VDPPLDDQPSEIGAGSTSDPSEGVVAPDAAERPPRFETMRKWFERSEVQLEAKYGELETRRGESAPIDVAFRVIEADRRYAGGLISGGMAFRIFVVIVPFAFVLVTAFGFFGEAVDASDPVALAKDLGMTGLVASAISASTDASTLERVVTLLAATYALLWGTWTLIRALRAVHGLAWNLEGLPALTRPWRPTLFAIAGMFGAFVGGAAISRLSDAIDPLAELLVRILLFGVFIAVWVWVSSLLPRADGTTWRALLPGAVLFGVGIEVLQFLTVYFFSRYIASKTETYGAIGASIAILLWAYFAGRLIVTAAFVNAARWRQSGEAAELSPGIDSSDPEAVDG
jgi:membrane protein